MRKTLRLTEKWMQRGLWLVALVFAWMQRAQISPPGKSPTRVGL